MLADPYPFAPLLNVSVDGNARFLTVRVRIAPTTATNFRTDLAGLGYGEVAGYEAMNRALLFYSLHRLERLVADLLASSEPPDVPAQVWSLIDEHIPGLLALIRDKACTYQVREQHGLYCVARTRTRTIEYDVAGVSAVPTSRPRCLACELPDTRMVCSQLVHVRVANGLTPTTQDIATISQAMCELDRSEVRQAGSCHAAGHRCWQRTLDVEPPGPAPTSPLGLPESFDVLDTTWRLVFGKKRRFVSPGTLLSVAALGQDCADRAEFESRLSALADIIDAIRVEDDLLPPGLTNAQKQGTINRLSECLLATLSADQHSQIHKAIRTLRLVRQARNAMQHGKVEGGLLAKLAVLGIHDAPPNWRGAWDLVRAHTSDALAILRVELRRWDDKTGT
jgi:hypothetical protein